MMISDKLKRWVVFYFSVILYLILLPIILSYSLGYKIDFKPFAIYKTGIIYLKTQPQGAAVYLNGFPVPNPTPTLIEELKPGKYNIEIKKEGYYPWQKDLVVRPNMVTKAEEIVLFPLSQEINKINSREVTDFAISDKNYIYYMSRAGLFRTALDGTGLKRLSPYHNWPEDIKGKKFSPDGDKLLYFNDYRIWVIYLNMDNQPSQGTEIARVEEVFKSQKPLLDAFWYSQSNYIVFVAGRDIDVIELSGQGAARNIVTLYTFSARPNGLYYDTNNDSLYFNDVSGILDSRESSCLYRLDLRQKFFAQFMQRFKKEFDIRYEKR